MFNIIAEYISGADILDLFAGSGSLGVEALSRGARSAVFVDKSPECAKVIRENLTHTKLMDKAVILTGDASPTIKKLCGDSRKFDIIFLDPPYNKNFIGEILKTIENNDIINRNGLVVAERDFIDDINKRYGRLELIRDQRYGDTVLSFFKASGYSDAVEPDSEREGKST